MQGAGKMLAQDGKALSHYKSLWIAAVVGAGCGLVSLVVILPILKKRADGAMAQR